MFCFFLQIPAAKFASNTVRRESENASHVAAGVRGRREAEPTPYDRFFDGRRAFGGSRTARLTVIRLRSHAAKPRDIVTHRNESASILRRATSSQSKQKESVRPSTRHERAGIIIYASQARSDNKAYARKVPDGRRVQTSSGFSCSEEQVGQQRQSNQSGGPVYFVATSPNTLGSFVFSFLRRHLPRCRSSGRIMSCAAHEQRAVTSVLLPGILKGAGGGDEARLLPLLRARLSSLSDKRDAVASSPAALRGCPGKRQRRRTRVHPGRGAPAFHLPPIVRVARQRTRTIWFQPACSAGGLSHAAATFPR